MAAEWKRFLIAVDETETSMRAVRYAGELAGPLQGIEILLFHVYPEPQPDYYRKGGTLRAYQKIRRQRPEYCSATSETSSEKRESQGTPLPSRPSWPRARPSARRS